MIKILTSVEYITFHTYQRPKPGGCKLKKILLDCRALHDIRFLGDHTLG